MNDTIAAVATSSGIGAISIIRVSGNRSLEIVNSIFDKDINNKQTHTITYGHIVDNNTIIDEVLVSIMLGPKSFTTENVVEINAHGGYATVKKILELLLNKGCRLAEPGEFTKRAFLNGRIDLIEAESVMDLINAKTESSRNLALNQLNGKVSKYIDDLRDELLNITANIEVNIDYPEYEDIKIYEIEDLKPKIEKIETQLKVILKESDNGKIIKEGINTAIIGRPNVGKSSILNCLLEENKAIVTDIAGTTRDVVEGTIILDGIKLNIIDTAGIRKTTDLVESIGVKKSYEIIDKSDLVLYVLNNNEEINVEDNEILSTIKQKRYLIIINKIDLESKLDLNQLDKNKIIYLSALNNTGIDDLKYKIKEMFNLNEIENKDLTYLSSARSISLVKQALKSLDDIKSGIEKNLPIDMIEIDIRTMIELLGEITGKTYHNDLIDKLFSNFCLGK